MLLAVDWAVTDLMPSGRKAAYLRPSPVLSRCSAGCIYLVRTKMEKLQPRVAGNGSTRVGNLVLPTCAERPYSACVSGLTSAGSVMNPWTTEPKAVGSIVAKLSPDMTL